MIQLLSIDPKERPSATDSLKILTLLYQKKKNFIVGEIPTRRYGHSSSIYNNSIYYFGGYSVDTKVTNEFFEFDKEKYEVRQIKQNPNVKSRFWHCSVTYKDFIYVFGGIGINSFDQTIFKFDIKKQEWIKVKYNFPIGLSHFSYILENDSVFIFGGMDSTKGMKVYNNLLEFNLKEEKIKFLNLKENISPRYGHSSVVYNGTMITYGGADDKGNISSDNNFFGLNLKTLIWKRLESNGDIPTPRNGMSLNIYKNEKLILFGGLKNFESEKFHLSSDLLYEYNLKTETWKKIKLNGEFPIKSYLHRADIIDDSMYISFGMTWNTHLRNEIYELNLLNWNFKNLNRTQKNLIGEWNRKYGYICIFCVERLKRSQRYICLECFGNICENCFNEKRINSKLCNHSFVLVSNFSESYEYFTSPKAPVK